MADPRPLVIDTLRYGYDDDTSAHELPADACTLARNVEFWNSSLGERRFGCEPVVLSSSGLDTETTVVHAVEWYPDGNPQHPEWFVIAATPGVSYKIAKRSYLGVWTAVTAADAIVTTEPNIYRIHSASVNGKLFVAYPSAVDRLHVWDGTTFRRAGLGQPVAAPTAVTTGSGTYSGTRFFRIRYVIQDGDGNVLVRGEPSDSYTFYPPGTGAGALITRPALLGEGETHWEVEASDNDTDYYMIATVVAATTTYTDTISGPNTIPTIPTTVTAPAGYVLLSNRAQALNITGTVSNGTYSDGTTFYARGWVMYTSAGVYVPAASWSAHNPPLTGDVTFASQDVATVLEGSVGQGSSYADNGELSEDIGTYLTQPSAVYLAAVDDRLVLGSNFDDETRMSSVYWTPVHRDPGKGNDERLPLTVDNNLDLDNGAGGVLTGIIPGINGAWYALKYQRIYKMNPTHNLTDAYKALTVSTNRGAIDGSTFSGVDQNGAACFFFADPHVGPFMVGAAGMLQMYGLLVTWRRVNLAATKIVCRGVYYPHKKQAHWWLAVDGENSPNFKIVNQVSELTEADGGLKRGWSLWDGRITEAMCASVMSETTTEDSNTFLRTYPFIGLDAGDLLQRCDTDVITDAGVSYVARIRTRPFISAGLIARFGVMVAALLASKAADTSIEVFLIRDMGQETTAGVTVDCSDPATVEQVVRDMDDLVLSECRTVQVEFGDPD
jgi:hypothetical protein